VQQCNYFVALPVPTTMGGVAFSISEVVYLLCSLYCVGKINSESESISRDDYNGVNIGCRPLVLQIDLFLNTYLAFGSLRSFYFIIPFCEVTILNMPTSDTILKFIWQSNPLGHL
jgi:hypothetical protein